MQKNNIKKTLLLGAILFAISFTISGCGKKDAEKISQQDEANIIKKCIERLYQNGSKQSYLIFPKYEAFDFNTFFKENKILEKYHKGYNYDKNKKKVLQSLQWSDSDFTQKQQKVNENYLNRTNLLLQKLSNSNVSHTVYFFSGIHENLVFANVIDYCDSIKSQDLNRSFNKNQKFMSAGSVIFIIKGGKVKDMIIDSGISVETQCP